MGSYDNPKHKAKHGDRVCPANGIKSVGIVIDIKHGSDDWLGKNYTILWGTGKKRGSISKHPGKNLVNLKCYLEAIQKHIEEVDALLQEASTVGM